MRICSLLPSATEIVYALGLGDDLVGVTHECDYPPEAHSKPVVSRLALTPVPVTSAEIDHVVRRSIAGHRSIYTIDEDLLAELAPDLILTQELCEVCAVSYRQVQAAARMLDADVRVLSLEPINLAGILDNIRLVGELTGRLIQAETLLAELQARVVRVGDEVLALDRRPRVACLEWLDPPMCAGHWVPEMVELAGGRDVFGQSGEHSRRVDWSEVVAQAPEVVVLMPCGFPLERVRASAVELTGRPGWSDLPAVRAGRVYAVDAGAYFSRSGPRVVTGLEILAGLIHPDRFDGIVPRHAAQPLAE